MRAWAGGPAGAAGPANQRPDKGARIMKKEEVKVGGTYLAKVGTRHVEVRIEGETPKGGWNAKSVASGKPIRIKDPKHLRPTTAADNPTSNTVARMPTHRRPVASHEALKIDNMDIVEELNLPPVKIHCSVLAEDAIKAAINDYRVKNGMEALKFEESVVH